MARRSDGAEGTSDMESLECTRDHDSIHRSRDEEELERKNDSKNAVSCRVCGDKASGKHYGTMTCDGCRGFFKRSVRRHLVYTCRDNNRCVVDVGRRNQCQSCRLQKCVQAGMKKDAVQHERAPRRRRTEGEELTSPPLADPERVEPAGDVPRLLPREALFSNYQCASSPRTAPLSPPLTPKPAITLESSEQLYELSVQILYTSITWARNIPTFNDLPFRDQIVVLEESWSELFLLSLAQWSLPIDMDLMLQLGGISKKDALSEEIKGAISDLARLQYIVQRFRVMDLDATEYACLKAVALFKPELQGLQARDHIEELQDQAQLTMQEHCRDRPPAARFGRLILKLPLLREISPQVIERFFFRGSLCNASSKKNHPLLFNWEYMIRESMRMMEDSERHY